ncbi:hypothetical protein PV04_04551 [Phialophora macrospora]|uniref:Transcription factor domain-containing protein n=1 Tax=Phialophora macrospora TaxID=1851006 RepID=A0A0D2E2Q6_9EURO|nr:hypothetical protein PV04_04551 [Phialophora macrospora]
MGADTIQPPQQATYTGNLLWVNHDQKSRNALPHRKRVFGHVQQNYRKWKRDHDNRQMQASIRLPGRTKTAVDARERRPEGGGQGNERQGNTTATRQARYHEALPPRDPELEADDMPQTGGALVLSDVPSPLTFLRRGNSDPFSSFSFAITARVNEVITFIRDIQLPTLYYSPYFREATRFPSTRADVTQSPMGWISTPAAVQSWKHIVQGLHDQCTALACLSTYLAMMVACGIKQSGYMKYSLELRNKSSRMLRQSISRTDPAISGPLAQVTLLQQVFWHFYAEASARNLHAAVVHGRMLRKLMDDHPEAVTPHFFMLAMFVDIHLSSTHRRRLLFEYATFGPRVYQGMWGGVDPYIHMLVGKETIPASPDGATVGTELDSSVSLEPLRSLVIRRRQVVALEKLIVQAEGPGINTTAIFFWIASHAYVDEGYFVTYYFDKIKATSIDLSGADAESEARAAAGGLESECKRLTEAALAMACLYLMRVLGLFDMWMNGQNFYDPGSSRESFLFDALTAAFRTGTPQELRVYANAHLWCLFVGAIAEWQAVIPGNQRGRKSAKQQAMLMAEAPSPTRLARVDSGYGEAEAPDMSIRQVRRAGSGAGANDEDASSMVFNSLFASQARMMGLMSWEQVAPVLRLFAYGDTLQPHGSRWFWKSMGAHLDDLKA